MCGDSRVKDWDLWEKILGALDHIRHVWGVEVAFWWVVPHSWNKDARSMAGMGLRVPPDTTVKEVNVEMGTPTPCSTTATVSWESGEYENENESQARRCVLSGPNMMGCFNPLDDFCI